MNITFTQQEKEDFLHKQGYIIDTVQGYIDDVGSQKDFPVKIAVLLGRPSSIDFYKEMLQGKYYANIQTEYGIDSVFERKFKKRLLEIL